VASEQHPDAAWLEWVREALDAWLAGPVAAPTSQVSGGGAVHVAEQRFSSLHQGRPALMVANATSGLLAALRTVGVGPGSRVLIPAVDWPGTLACVRALGATAVVVPSDPDTLTMSPEGAAAAAATPTAAIVVTHVLGIPADVPAIRRAVGGVPLIEDCAQALGSTLDGVPVGCGGDLSVFSFGPGKLVDIGEGGMVACRDWDTWTRLVREAGHPVRQALGGIDQPHWLGLASRPHPLAAVLLAERLAHLDLDQLRARHAWAADELAAELGGPVPLGHDGRRGNAAALIPVRSRPRGGPPATRRCRFEPCGVYQIDRLARSGEAVAASAWLCRPEPRPAGGDNT
jgi:dTDP-4-amino-4,6-dideoxygalactose transaminase